MQDQYLILAGETTRHADIPISKQDGDMDEGKFGCSVNEAAEC